MAGRLAFGGGARPVGRGVSSVACLAFVLTLGAAFWAAAAWLGENFIAMGASLP